MLLAGTLQPARLSANLCLLASATLAQEIRQCAQEASTARQAAHHALAVLLAHGLKQELLSVSLVQQGISVIARTQSPSVSKVSTRSKTCSPAKPARLASSAILALTLPRLFSSPVRRATTVLCLAPLSSKLPVLLATTGLWSEPPPRLKDVSSVRLDICAPLRHKTTSGIRVLRTTTALEALRARPAVPRTLTSQDSRPELSMNVRMTQRATTS